MKVIIAKTEKEMESVKKIRKEVFIKEQGVSPEEEWDHLETSSIHFLASQGGKPIGAGRLRLNQTSGKAERICVLEEYRGSGIGKALMEALESYVLEQKRNEVILHAQTRARAFYEHLGYRTTSDLFMDAGIPHVCMEKNL